MIFFIKKIGELELERAIIFYGRKAVIKAESETLEEHLENYRDNMGILLEKVRNEVEELNHSNRITYQNCRGIQW